MPQFDFEVPETGTHRSVHAPDEETARQLVVQLAYHDAPEGEGDQPYTGEEVEWMRQVRAERAAALRLI